MGRPQLASSAAATRARRNVDLPPMLGPLKTKMRSLSSTSFATASSRVIQYGMSAFARSGVPGSVGTRAACHSHSKVHEPYSAVLY